MKKKKPAGKRARAKNTATMPKKRCKKRCKARDKKNTQARTMVAKLRDQVQHLSARLREKVKRKANPHRAPRRWFESCLSSVTAQRHARDPAAVCAATWWKLPVARRRAIVRKLERGTRRERRAAVAIAKAERNRCDRGAERPRRKNPSSKMSDAEAMREYERTHWGHTGRKSVRELRAADPAHGTGTEMGELVEVVYRTRKGRKGKVVEYEHAFEDRLPTLAYNDGGLIIAGGSYTIERGGITG